MQRIFLLSFVLPIVVCAQERGKSISEVDEYHIFLDSIVIADTIPLSYFDQYVMDTAGFVPFKNIYLSLSASDEFLPCEPSVAINPKDPQNVVIAASLNKIFHTMDAGEVWADQRISSPHGVWGNPALVCDKRGNFYFFHLSDPTGKNWLSNEILDRIVVQKSKDNGMTWDEGTFIGNNPPKDQEKISATTDRRGRLYATWTQFDKFGSDKTHHKSNILYSFSSNQAKKWSEPVQINQHSGNCIDDNKTVQGAMPAVHDDGKIFVTWTYDDLIYLDRSFDKGKTWLQNDIVVTEQPGGANISIPGVQQFNGKPVLIADNSETSLNGMIHLSWADQKNGEEDTDIWFISSHNGGDTWSSRVRVNDDEPGKHQFMSSMAQDATTGFIYIVFYDRRNYDDNQTDVFLAYSTDGGRKFRNEKISEKPFIPDEDYYLGDYISIAAHEGVIVPVWTRMDDGKTTIVSTIIRQQELDMLQMQP